MLKDLDDSILAMLQGEATEGSELASATISFAVPDESWRNTGTTLTLNIYLYDIRENRTLRSNDLIKSLDSEGNYTINKAEPRVDCSFIITAWNKSDTDDPDNILIEHRLLSQVLEVLLKNSTVPSSYLSGLLEDQEPDVRISTSKGSGVPNPVEFWTALGTPFRASLDCTFTITLDLNQEIETASIVSSSINQFSINESQEKVITFGGLVLDSDENPIENAIISITELDLESNSNSEGKFYFNGISEATDSLNLEVSAEGFNSSSLSISIPFASRTDYLITLEAEES